MATVIIGAGIIGTSIAFYLSDDNCTSPANIHLVESSPELFASASGYAGGFLARDWFSPAVSSLGALSFDLHRQLAEEYLGAERWGYSKTTTLSLSQGGGRRGDDWLREGTSRAQVAAVHDTVVTDGPLWLRQERFKDLENISSGGTTAQVNPLRLCQFLLAKCQSRGVQLHHPASPVSVEISENGIPISVTLMSLGSTATIACNRLIFATGAWTPSVYQKLLPGRATPIPITSLAGHSLVLRSPKWRADDEVAIETQGCYAVYTTEEHGYSPEIFARAGGEIYIAGINDASIPLPEHPTDRQIDAQSIAKLKDTAQKLLRVEYEKNEGHENATKASELKVLREGLCWRPITNNGAPFICPLYEESTVSSSKNFGPDGGIWLAAGHGPWGISLSLGTGKVVAEMVQGQKTSADVSRLTIV